MGKCLGRALLLFVALGAPLSWAAPPHGSERPALTEATSVSPSVACAELSDLLRWENEQTRSQITALRPSLWDKALPAIAAIIAALATSIAAFFLQRARLRFDRESEFQKAGVEAISVIKNFRSRQLNEFYAPLQALLKQSHVLRDELYQRILKAPPPGVAFKMKKDERAFSGSSLHIRHPGERFKAFRLIDEMRFIQNQCPNLMPNIAAIVGVNEHVEHLLLNKIGLVRPENTELSGVLGQFLAHKCILDEVFEAAQQASATTSPLGYATAYPRNLNALVATDCELLRHELTTWEHQVTAWITQVGGRMSEAPETSLGAR